jgi:hypothetical protein
MCRIKNGLCKTIHFKNSIAPFDIYLEVVFYSLYHVLGRPRPGKYWLLYVKFSGISSFIVSLRVIAGVKVIFS